MAKLVAAVGTPHGPMLPKQVADAPGQLRSEALMTQVRNELEKAEPDLIFVVASDHFTNFFTITCLSSVLEQSRKPKVPPRPTALCLADKSRANLM